MQLQRDDFTFSEAPIALLLCWSTYQYKLSVVTFWEQQITCRLPHLRPLFSDPPHRRSQEQLDGWTKPSAAKSLPDGGDTRIACSKSKFSCTPGKSTTTSPRPWLLVWTTGTSSITYNIDRRSFSNNTGTCSITILQLLFPQPSPPPARIPYSSCNDANVPPPLNYSTVLVILWRLWTQLLLHTPNFEAPADFLPYAITVVFTNVRELRAFVSGDPSND